MSYHRAAATMHSLGSVQVVHKYQANRNPLFHAGGPESASPEDTTPPRQINFSSRRALAASGGVAGRGIAGHHDDAEMYNNEKPVGESGGH